MRVAEIYCRRVQTPLFECDVTRVGGAYESGELIKLNAMGRNPS